MKNVNQIILSILLFCDFINGQSILFNSQFQMHDLRSVIDDKWKPKWSGSLVGVYTFSLIFNHRLSNSINLGIGYGIEKTMTTAELRPDLLNISSVTPFDDLTIDRQIKHIIFFPISYSKSINSRLSFGLQTLLGIGIYRKYYNTRNKSDTSPETSMSNVFYNDMEFIPFIRYKINRCSLNFGIRVFHLKMVDRSIFYKDFFDKWDTVIDSEVYKNSIDIYNPFKINVGIEYKI